jgi:hypothetical protein
MSSCRPLLRVLAHWKASSACWSSTRQGSSCCIITSSRDNIAERLLTWRKTPIIPPSMYFFLKKNKMQNNIAKEIKFLNINYFVPSWRNSFELIIIIMNCKTCRLIKNSSMECDNKQNLLRKWIHFYNMLFKRMHTFVCSAYYWNANQFFHLVLQKFDSSKI